MDLTAFDFWGMVAMGNIFSSGGRLSFISSQRIMRACPTATFSFASAAKCASALGVVADWWGPLSIAAIIWACVHCFLVIAGHPS